MGVLKTPSFFNLKFKIKRRRRGGNSNPSRFNIVNVNEIFIE